MKRIIDANINRLREGLRVIEDILRFYYDFNYFEEFKKIRHRIKELEKSYPYNLVFYRESEEDKGRKKYNVETNDNVYSVLKANFKRTQESSRVLEEIFKIEDINISYIFKEIRFSLYTLEKAINEKLFKKNKLNFTLYLITDSRLTDKPLEYVVEEAIKGGVDIVQLREKHLSDAQIIKKGEAVKKVCRKYNVPLIIDDRIDICLILDADGVHLGQDDIPVNFARRILGPEKIIGKSTHSIEQAEEALKEETDYIAFGPIFKTPTKDYSVVGTDKIEEVKQIVEKYDKKLVLIGGIDSESIKRIGIKLPVASVRFIIKEPYKNARELKKFLGENL
ncbi:MAG TPA: thiamine phosphate synthase [Spirochaetota bacterium]|nr:thiamine phosphate synthase [Spirochaetota bacterium]HOM39246.1 thiamine phosphate synthase [Spirochaetota bacterium]